MCFNNLGQLLNCKRNVRLKIVASRCDQCVWVVGVVAGSGHWYGIERCDQWTVCA